DPRDHRTRPSILIQIQARPPEPLAGRRGDDVDETSGRQEAFSDAVRSILVDTSTDLRMQALTNDVQRVDAILFTHSHADHVFGLDDVRRYNQMQQAPIPC